jgi:hypothetical protein
VSFESPITITATAAEICARFSLKRDAKNLLREGMDPHGFAIALVENKMCADAIEFMAHALPAREGIWWGCLCMQHALGENLSLPDRAAATAAVRWVMEPIEENRVAAKAPADAAPPPSVPGSLAMAAYQSGGNVAPPGSPFKAPAPFAPANGIALAVKLASIKTEPIKIARMQRSYVELAIAIAEEGLG